jgi:DNA replication licensing factor MCM4
MSSYLELCNPGNSAGGGTRTISATPRQLESLIRLSEALAKMHYRTVVTRADAQEAVHLLKVPTQAAITDPRTGRIDMDMINTGRSSADRQSEEDVQLQLQELLTQRRGMRLAVRDVRRQLAEVSSDGEAPAMDRVVEALRTMQSDGFIQFNERAQTIFVRQSIAR